MVPEWSQTRWVQIETALPHVVLPDHIALEVDGVIYDWLK